MRPQSLNVKGLEWAVAVALQHPGVARVPRLASEDLLSGGLGCPGYGVRPVARVVTAIEFKRSFRPHSIWTEHI